MADDWVPPEPRQPVTRLGAVGGDELMAPPRNPAMPAEWAQRAVRTVGGKIADIVMAPRRAMDQGMTTEEAIPWAGDTALGMAGASAPFAARGAVGAAGGKLVQPEGIRAYHGSPHDFERFDMSRIGTGEGAQAYGHGLYFAENPAVAGEYKQRLSGGALVSGKDAFEGWNWLNSTTRGMASNALEQARQHGHTGDEAVRWAIEKLKMPEGAGQSERLHFIDAQNAVGSLLGKQWEPNRGRMYEVNINAKPEQFLDWDRPLAADNPARQAATDVLKKPGLFTLEPESTLRGFRRENVLKPEATGADVYQTVSRGLAQGKGYKPSEATSVMREAGIPGIKYLDQGSRTGGSGTSNYVVFDDKLIDILRKYGVSSIAALPPAVQAAIQNRQRPPEPTQPTTRLGEM
jgi:hypothetical protein